MWALMSTAAVQRIEWHTYITLPHRLRTCQAAYTISKDVRHSLTPFIGTLRRDRVGSAPPPPRQPICPVLSRHGWTDLMEMKDALVGWSAGGPMHAQCSTVDTCALGSRAIVPAHQRRQVPRSFPNDADHRASWPPPPRYKGLIAGHRCLNRRP